MINLTSSTFDQALTGNALVFFHRLKGCPNCDKMSVHVESFQKEGVNVFDVDVDAEKELTGKYAPIGQWSLPLLLYIENGKVINMKTGITNILDITKTLDNISSEELEAIFLDAVIDQAQKQKALFESDMHLRRVGEQRQRRMSIANGEQNITVPQTAPLSALKLEDDFVLGESTAGEPETCESCQ